MSTAIELSPDQQIVRDALVDPLLIASTDPEILERFWGKVSRSDGCWDWVGARDRNGYGSFVLRKGFGRTIKVKAHRLAWVIANKRSIGDGLLIRHSCDREPCVRRDHLLEGTEYQNTHDCIDRGRFPRGETSGMGKLKAVEIPIIRQLLSIGKPRRAIGRLFNVSEATINDIAHNRTWRHI